MKKATVIEQEDLPAALSCAIKCMKRVRKCMKSGRHPARRAPLRSSGRYTPRASNNAGVSRILPYPGHEPDPMPPIGEKWVHIGEGAFVPARQLTKANKEAIAERRHWSDT